MPLVDGTELVLPMYLHLSRKKIACGFLAYQTLINPIVPIAVSVTLHSLFLTDFVDSS